MRPSPEDTDEGRQVRRGDMMAFSWAGEKPGTSRGNGHTVWGAPPKKPVKKDATHGDLFCWLTSMIPRLRRSGRRGGGLPALCRMACPPIQRRGASGRTGAKVFGGRGDPGGEGGPFSQRGPFSLWQHLFYRFSRSSWLSRAWRTKTARTPGSSPRPVSTGRGVRPRVRTCEAQESGSSPARSLRA